MLEANLIECTADRAFVIASAVAEARTRSSEPQIVSALKNDLAVSDMNDNRPVTVLSFCLISMAQLIHDLFRSFSPVKSFG